MPKFTHCQKCKKKVSKRCSKGFCNKCRDRSGQNNPFFGRKHDKIMIEATKRKLSQISKNLWSNPKYRESIIKSISKPRRVGFREEQSQRVSKWYKDNPQQAVLRREQMKRSWLDGKIEPNINSINESKDERSLLEEVKLLFPERDVRKATLKIKGRWFYPDIRIDKDAIIEFFGDYWHGNPAEYLPTDILIGGMTANQIWLKDEERVNFLRENGFNVLTVWQRDYKKDEEKVKKDIAFWLKSVDSNRKVCQNREDESL